MCIFYVRAFRHFLSLSSFRHWCWQTKWRLWQNTITDTLLEHEKGYTEGIAIKFYGHAVLWYDKLFTSNTVDITSQFYIKHYSSSSYVAGVLSGNLVKNTWTLSGNIGVCLVSKMIYDLWIMLIKFWIFHARPLDISKVMYRTVFLMLISFTCYPDRTYPIRPLQLQWIYISVSKISLKMIIYHNVSRCEAKTDINTKLNIDLTHKQLFTTVHTLSYI